ncbi:ABC transporter permease [Ferruginibacter yonginensis]|uniref:ABC transporter permease n=1 Tax=Ferruginibacter yonginensis TaxID=1310416 RepID=A0ABV8QRU7_9BACT
MMSKPKFWQLFKKNKLALVAMFIIVAAVLVSIFAYMIAPDNSPNANLQTVEIQSKQMGYQQLFLKLPLRNNISASLLSKCFWGTPLQHQYIPITSYTQKADSVIIQKLVDVDTSITVAYHINQVKENDADQLQQHIILKKYGLGTDAYGRDILSRLIIGTRVSLMVGIVAMFISILLGVLLGAWAGYYGGVTDKVIMWLINVMWSIPTLLLVFALTLTLGKGFWQIFIAVGLTLWVSVARLVRAQVMAAKALEYVKAATTLGFSNNRIIFKHILPNIMGPILVLAASNFATAIIVEAGLSFLGIGVQPPQPSWGLMIKENYNLIITHNALQAIIPGIAIMMLVLAINILGNALRDLLDVKDH